MSTLKKPETYLKLLKDWGLSLILIFFSWFILKQFWQALTSNIFFAVNYNHPVLFSPLYFIIDSFTLFIHEAGHVVFGIFRRRFLTIAGGTLLQLLVPFGVFIYAFINKKTSAAQLALYWLGFGWLDTAAYCADAIYRQMPLLGGLPKSAHDFHNMLSQLDMLRYSEVFAWSMYAAGALTLLLSVLWPLFKPEEVHEVNLDLNL